MVSLKCESFFKAQLKYNSQFLYRPIPIESDGQEKPDFSL